MFLCACWNPETQPSHGQGKRNETTIKYCVASRNTASLIWTYTQAATIVEEAQMQPLQQATLCAKG